MNIDAHIGLAMPGGLSCQCRAAMLFPMSEPRKILSLQPSTKTPEERDAEALALLTLAIGRKQCVRWTYNQVDMEAAPQAVYLKKESLYCDAVVTHRNGIKSKELKLGSFRLSGLKGIKLSENGSELWPDIQLSDGRYGVIIAAWGQT